MTTRHTTERPMDRETLAQHLLAMPAEILAAERRLLAAEQECDTAGRALQAAEDRLLLETAEDPETGPLAGKNESIRAAKLRVLTESERAAVRQAQTVVAEARLLLHRAQNDFSAARAAARVLAAGEE